MCRFETSERPILPEPLDQQLLSVTYTPLGECSVIANNQQHRNSAKEGPFRLLGINGQLDFSLTSVCTSSPNR